MAVLQSVILDNRALFVRDSYGPMEVGTGRATLRPGKPYEDRWKNCSSSGLPTALDQQGPHKYLTRRPVIVVGLQTDSAQMAQKTGKSGWSGTVRISKLTSLQSLCSCIETGEFMHVYNAIIVLKEILPVFPLAAVGEYGPVIDNMIDKLVEGEERGDLKILSRA